MAHHPRPATTPRPAPQPAGTVAQASRTRNPGTAAPGAARLQRLAALAAALGLAACGGGGGGSKSDPPVAAPPPAPTTSITGKVVDGPLQGAIACYDLNDNLRCDPGEPASAATDAAGAYALTVPAAAAGQHAVVVDVPAGAVDADTGAPIGLALTLVAPATQVGGAGTVFVSPLTSMVAQQMQTTGASAAQAAAFIQAQAGLAISPLQDFTGNTPEARQAQLLARLSVQARKEVAAGLAGQLGQPDASGGTITQADIDQAAALAVLSGLQPLAAAVADPALAESADITAALQASARALVQTQPALDPAAALAVAVAAKGERPADLPEAGATLRALSFTSATDWSLRAMLASAADNTPDAAGQVRFYDLHRKSVGGVVTSWGYGSDESRKDDLHWNGSAWVDCPVGTRSTQTVRDAQGRATYDYCQGREKGSSARTTTDIAGRTIASVVTQQIRAFPGSDSGLPYSAWGPADLGLLGSATFPVGSQLLLQQTTPTEALPLLIPSSPATTFGVEAAAGGNARGAPPQPLACLSAFNGAISSTPVATLEQLVNNNRGTPCLVNPGSDASGRSVDPDNQWWSATSLSLGNVANAATPPAGTGNYFSTTANLRVAFTGGAGNVTYYSCLVRTNGGGVRNCSVVGQGSYGIATLGGARVMTFSNLPAVAQRLDSRRVYVEREGTVYVGYQPWTGVTRTTLRLNLTAANAVLGTLGLAPLVP